MFSKRNRQWKVHNIYDMQHLGCLPFAGPYYLTNTVVISRKVDNNIGPI